MSKPIDDRARRNPIPRTSWNGRGNTLPHILPGRASGTFRRPGLLARSERLDQRPTGGSAVSPVTAPDTGLHSRDRANEGQDGRQYSQLPRLSLRVQRLTLNSFAAEGPVFTPTARLTPGTYRPVNR